jgi:dienelactone hydrolase
VKGHTVNLLIPLKTLWAVIKRLSLIIIDWLRKFVPGRRARYGAGVGAVATVLLIYAIMGPFQLRSGWGAIIDVIVGLLIGAAFLGLFFLAVSLALSILRKFAVLFTAIVAGAAIALMAVTGFPPDAGLPLDLGILLVAALLGGSIAVMTDRDFRNARLSKRISITILLLLCTGAVVWSGFWIFDTGDDTGVIKLDESAFPAIALLNLPDPSQVGAYTVKHLTYGSGDDRRPEYGEGATIKTRTIDGKPFVNKLDGWFASFRKWYWGFDRRKFPLNGRVWYPEGSGPFPLVLIVHGNHHMREYSDPGYAYLGELLASRGYIFVSVDENFLNGDWSDNYNRENDARAWVLLEHLRLWREWSTDSSSQFRGTIDLNNIALIGHSRGGEAVSVAAAFNRLQRYPDDARVQFDYGFNIRSVIAIAPIDGQYMPSGVSTPLSNINYLVVQGSHDADLSFFSGDRQYKRIRFTGNDYFFKTSLYIYRANHGQFNTVWGKYDWGRPHGIILNTKELLAGEDQRQVARVYFSAFLEVTLKNNRSYLPMFRDYRLASSWVPKTYYVNRFEDSRTLFVADFGEDIDVTSTTLPGGRLLGEHLATWKEEDQGFRKGETERQNQVVVLGWEYPDSAKSDSTKGEKEAKDTVRIENPARYTISFPADLGKIRNPSVLTFALAETDRKPDKPDSLYKTDDEEEKKKDGENKKSDEEKKVDSLKTPLDFTIELSDRSGRTARLALTEVMPLMPPLKAKFTRYPLAEKFYGSASEPTLQTYEVRFADLKRLNPGFDPTRIRELRMIFDRSRKGVIMLDEVGLR